MECLQSTESKQPAETARRAKRDSRAALAFCCVIQSIIAKGKRLQ